MFLHAEDFQSEPAQIRIAFCEKPFFELLCERRLRDSCLIGMPVIESDSCGKQTVRKGKGIDQGTVTVVISSIVIMFCLKPV